MPAKTPSTIPVRSGPTTHQARVLARDRFKENKTELTLIVGGTSITVKLENAQVSAHDEVNVAQSFNWTIVGTIVTDDTRLAEVGLRYGGRLIALYNSSSRTGIAW